jgi:threonine aldolase
MIDVRSDTVTRPTPGMRTAMASAPLGDDVFGEDPTTNALEARVASLFEREASLFVTSGTMGNQLAIACQTAPGDEVLVGQHAHPVHYEAAAASALSGVQIGILGTGGMFTADDVTAAIRPPAYYQPRTRLVCVENTHNRAGGRVFPQAAVREITSRAREHGLASHLDGARIWNAHVATGTPLRDLAHGFDSISVCFSKGLGAPVGSALVGSRALVEGARRLRKRWGGGMRQSGVLAAAALYAIEHHIARLADDHANARAFAAIVSACDDARVQDVETNIVNVDVARVLAERVAGCARDLGLAIHASDTHRLRAVFHLDVDADAAREAARILVSAIEQAVQEAST